MYAKKICAAIAAMLVGSSAMLVSFAAPIQNDGQPSEVNADAIEYDMNTGLVSAEGNVLLKHGPTRATGLHALFNVNTKAAKLFGNVIVTREDMRLTCNALESNGEGHMFADGNVVAVQTVLPNEKYPDGDQRTFTGEHIDYFPDDRKHVVIPRGGVAESKVEGTFTADRMEGWIDDEHYIGDGNAHLVSPARNLEAGGDNVDYSGKDQGRAILSGNAWAYQDNNTIRGNRLTVYLADDGNLKADDANKFKTPDTPKISVSDFDRAFEEAKRGRAVDKPAEAPPVNNAETSAEQPDEANANES